jgi:hypothetical protein
MAKPVVNNRIVYQNMYGRVIQHEEFLNQGVTTGDSPTFGNVRISQDAYIEGNLYVEGNSTIFDTNLIEFEDNIILLNRLESGSGVTLNQAGFEVERGSAENYRIVFNEPDDTFRVGFLSNLLPVAIREETPLNNGIITWSTSQQRLNSVDNIGIDLSLSSTTDASSPTNGCLKLSGGLGVQKNINANGNIIIKGNSISTNTAQSFALTSLNDISLLPTNNVLLPFDKKLAFGNTSQSISVNSTTSDISITGKGNVTFQIDSGKRIAIPNQIPITFSTVNEKIYTDAVNNMVITGLQDINLTPGTNKKVLVPPNNPLCFGSASQSISANINSDLSINAGNNITLSPGSLQDVRIPTDNTLKFGNTGSQRIYANSSNELYITATKDIFLSPSQGNIFIPQSRLLAFNNTNNSISSDSLGNIQISATRNLISKNPVTLQSTENSSSGTNASLYCFGGIGVAKDLNVNGNATVQGNLSVLGTYSSVDVQTVNIQDNLLVVNNGPFGLSDGGLLIKHFQSGSSGSTKFAGIVFQDSSKEFNFISTNSDPGASNVTIEDYIPVSCRSISIKSTSNSVGLGSGGSVTVLGGASISKNMYIGGELQVSSRASFADLQISGTVYSTSSGNFESMVLRNTQPSSNASTGALLVKGGLTVQCTENSSSNSYGGGITVQGGASIVKNVFIGGNLALNSSSVSFQNTTGMLIYSFNKNSANDFSLSRYSSEGNYIEDSFYINFSSGNVTFNNTNPNSLIVKGDMSIHNTNNASNLSSASFIVKGGQSISKDLLVGGDLSVLSTTNSNSTTSGSFVLSGGAGIERNVNIGGTLSVLNNADFQKHISATGNILFDTINNTNGSLYSWHHLGVLNNSIIGYCDLEISNGVWQKNTSPDNQSLRVILSINGTTTSFSHQSLGNLEKDAVNKVNCYVYKNSIDDTFHLFVKSPPLSTSNVKVNGKLGNAFEINFEGVDSNPNGLTSGFSSLTFTNVYSTSQESTLDFSCGDLTVDGTNLKVCDNLPIIGYNNINTISSRDIGILYQRYQKTNDNNNGDIINDTPAFQDVLPNQSTSTSTQIKLSNAASSSNNFYTGWWIKVTSGLNTNQIRQVISYNGSQRVAEIDTTWTSQNPSMGDTVSLFNKSFVSQYFDQTNDTFKLGYVTTNNDNYVSYQEDANLQTGHLLLTNTSDSLACLGKVSISNTTNSTSSTNGGSFTTLGGAAVKRKLFVGEKICLGGDNSDNTNSLLSISNTNASISLKCNTNNFNFIDFDDSSSYRFGILNDSQLKSLSFTLSSSSQTPNLSQKVMSISSQGNLAINTTTNVNSILTLQRNNFISCDGNNGFIGIIADASNSVSSTNGSKIILNGINGSGDLSMYAAPNGALRFFSSNTETMTVNNNGSVQINTTTRSSSHTTGALIVSGGVAVSSTENSFSNTNGGSLTVNGGASVAKDLYLGGSLYVNGSVTAIGAITSPTITFSNTQGCSISNYGNSKLLPTNTERMLSFYIEVLPSSSSQNCQFEFTIPDRTTNFNNRGDLIVSCNGYTDDTNIIPLFNTICVGSKTSPTGILKFQSVSTAIHYFTIIARYTST